MASQKKQAEHPGKQPNLPAQKYLPYRKSLALDTPLLHHILEPCGLLKTSCIEPLLAAIYRIRWMLATPLRIALMPKQVRTTLSSLPCFGNVIPSALLNATAGDLLLHLPLIVWFMLGYHYTFVNPSVDSSGNMATYTILATYFTANKSNSIFSFCLGIPFERMIPLHYASSMLSLLLTGFHVSVAYRYGDDSGDEGDSRDLQQATSTTSTNPSDIWNYLWQDGTNQSGSIAMFCMLALVLSSISFVRVTLRRYLFQFWYLLHVLWAVGSLIALFYHEVSLVVLVMFWWGLDVALRYGIMASCQFRGKATLHTLGGSKTPIVELRIAKSQLSGFDYQAGQFVQVCVPQVSVWEFHPITISSAPHESHVTFHVRALGDWSRKLVALAHTDDSEEASSPPTSVNICLEGPYGVLGIDLADDRTYSMAVLVSGGIGVTPCMSLTKSLWHQHTQLGRRLEYLHFVWAVPDVAFANDFQSKLTLSKHTASKAQIRMDIYETRSSKNKTRKSASIVDEEAVSSESHSNWTVVTGRRPNVDEILSQAREAAMKLGETNVAVIGCGPEPLMQALEQACVRHSTSLMAIGTCTSNGGGVMFDLHREHFEF